MYFCSLLFTSSDRKKIMKNRPNRPNPLKILIEPIAILIDATHKALLLAAQFPFISLAPAHGFMHIPFLSMRAAWQQPLKNCALH